MRLADEIQELFEEAMREVDRLSLNAVRAAAFGVGHWLAGLWPRMPCEGWQDELDWLLREYARNHLFITDQSRADIIAWVTAANEEAKRDALVPGSAGPRLVDICYGPRPQPAALRTAHDKPAPLDPDYPALRRVGHIIMEQFPPADWLKLAAGRLKRDPVPEEIAQQFLAWIEAEQRKALGIGVLPQPGGGVLAHNDSADGAGNSSAFDRAFPEPPFAQALGLPKINNPPFGDIARRSNLQIPQGAGVGVRAAGPGGISWSDTARATTLDVSGDGLATRLFKHYEGGSGTPFILNYDDMVALKPTNVSPTQSAEFKAAIANATKEARAKGKPVDARIKVSLQTKANAILTLNTFTIYHNGVLTVRPDGTWTYHGDMMFSDTFDFEDHPNAENPGEPNRDADERTRNFQARIVRDTIVGRPFEVKSPSRADGGRPFQYAETSESPSQEVPWYFRTRGLK